MKRILKNYTIQAPLDVVFQAFTDPEAIKEWSGSPAQMDDQEGTQFKLWNGDIQGTNKEITPHQIVQDWKAGDWEDPSEVTFHLNEDQGETTVTLIHQNIPEEAFDMIDKGWDESYMGPLKEWAEKQSSGEAE